MISLNYKWYDCENKLDWAKWKHFCEGIWKKNQLSHEQYLQKDGRAFYLLSLKCFLFARLQHWFHSVPESLQRQTVSLTPDTVR